MNIELKRIGKTILELRVETHNATITESVTDLNSIVDINLINTLRQIADEMEEHNLKNKQNDRDSSL